PAENDSELSLVQNRKELLGCRGRVTECFTRGVHHEVSSRHFAGRNKRRKTSQEAKRNQKSADEFDDTSDKHQTFRAAVPTTWKSKKFLAAVTSKHKSDDESHNTVNRIGESIEKVHSRSS